MAMVSEAASRKEVVFHVFQCFPARYHPLRRKAFSVSGDTRTLCNRLPRDTIFYMAHDWHMKIVSTVPS